MPSLLFPTPTPNRRRRRARWPLAAALAVAVHGGFVALLLLMSGAATSKPAQSVAMRTISARQWAATRGQPRPEPPDAPKPPREELPKGQVVGVAPGNRERPEDAKFLAESNNRVEKETQSKDRAEIAPNVTRQRTSQRPSDLGGDDDALAAQSAGNGGTGRDSAPAAEAAQKQARVDLPSSLRQDRLAMQTPEPEGRGNQVASRRRSPSFEGSADRLRMQDGASAGDIAASEGSAGAARDRLNLIPPASVLGSTAGATRPDHLRDVEEGAQTLLNTVMWKHAGFMNRIRDQIYGRWTRNLDSELALRDPTLSIYLGRDRYTILLVAMNAEGQIQDIAVARSSGVDFLDQAAVQAFYSAQPFPSPPPQLQRDDGTFVIPFGFTVHRNSGGIVIRSGPPPPSRLR